MTHNKLTAIKGLVAGLTLLSASCAVHGSMGNLGLASPPPSQPVEAARLGLAPALRPFYDELTPYGDWMPVEPHGWVFRPRVNTVAWRPYRDGHWEPSYAFGWVWESNDEFGWITDHYGFWFHDDFQGWLWQPYGAWAPAWVAWVQVGDYVGWAPLAPDGATESTNLPGGAFTYVSLNSLAQPSAAAHANNVSSVPVADADMRPIDRVASYRGVYWNAGPDLGEVLGTSAAERLRMTERDQGTAAIEPGRSPLREPRELSNEALHARTLRAVRVAQRELRAARALNAKPGNTPPAPAGDRRFKPGEPAPRDSSGIAPGDSVRRSRRGGVKSGSGDH